MTLNRMPVQKEQVLRVFAACIQHGDGPNVTLIHYIDGH